jgi:hypothetical protein
MSDFNPTPYLEKLERLVDPAHVERAEARQAAAWRLSRWTGGRPLLPCATTGATSSTIFRPAGR